MGVEKLGFDFWADQIGQWGKQFATAATALTVTSCITLSFALQRRALAHSFLNTLNKRKLGPDLCNFSS